MWWMSSCVDVFNVFRHHCFQHICEAVASVPVPPVGITQGLNHFWHHLEKDFQILQLALGKSMDDAALLVHLLLHKMLTTSPPRNGMLALH